MADLHIALGADGKPVTKTPLTQGQSDSQKKSGMKLADEPKKKEVRHRNNVWFCQKVNVQQASIPGYQELPPELKNPDGSFTVLVPIVGPAISTIAVKRDAMEVLGEKMKNKVYKVAALSDDIKPGIKQQLKIEM